MHACVCGCMHACVWVHARVCVFAAWHFFLHCSFGSQEGFENFKHTQSALLMTCQIRTTCLGMSSHDFKDHSSRAIPTVGYVNFPYYSSITPLKPTEDNKGSTVCQRTWNSHQGTKMQQPESRRPDAGTYGHSFLKGIYSFRLCWWVRISRFP